MAQKPYAGRALDSIVETGVGALNIDAARVLGLIRTDRNDMPSDGMTIQAHATFVPGERTYATHPQGR